MNKLTLTSILIVFMSIFSYAQNSTIKGKVIDKITNEPMLGANVIIENTSKGAITDNLGRFEIKEVKSSEILLISYVGYKSQKISVDNETINIYLGHL